MAFLKGFLSSGSRLCLGDASKNPEFASPKNKLSRYLIYKKMIKKFFKITPLLRLPANIRQEYTYHLDEKLTPGFIPEAGDLISVEFRRRKVLGVLISKDKDGMIDGKADSKTVSAGASKIARATKPILRLIQKSFLPTWQIDFLKKAADHYWSSQALFFKTACPAPSGLRQSLQETGTGSHKFKMSKAELELAQKIITTAKTSPELALLYPDRFHIYCYLISRALNQKGQILLLVPESTLLRAWYFNLKKIFGPGQIALLDKDKAPGYFFKNRNAILNKQKPIVLGTRSAIFAPFTDLKLIIVDEAFHDSLKQWDRNPRYDARLLVKMLGESFDCLTIWGGNSFLAADYYQFLKKKAVMGAALGKKTNKKTAVIENKLSATAKKTKSGKQTLVKIKTAAEELALRRPRVISTRPRSLNKIHTAPELFPENVFDASQPKMLDRSRILTEPILNTLGETLAKGQTVFLGIPQKGQSGGYYCKDCGYIPACESCNTNYYLAQDNWLKCPVCGKKEKALSRCPKCQSPLIKLLGTGSARLAEEVKQLFPGYSCLLLSDEKNSKTREKNEWLALSLKQAVIISQLSSLNLARFNPNTGAVLLINPDKSLFLTDFNAQEKRFHELANLVSKNYLLQVQTKYPHDQILFEALSSKWETFYSRIIKQYQQSNLPPFSQLIKFSVRLEPEAKQQNPLVELKKMIMAPSEAPALKKSTTPKAAIAQKTAKTQPPEIIFGGEIYPGYPEKVRGRYVFHLTIGIKKPLPEEQIKAILDFSFKNGIVIDVDPVGLL